MAAKMSHITATDTTVDLEEAIADEREEERLSEAEIEQIKKKSVSGVISYFIRTAILQGIGLISALVLAAFLSPEDFGIYGIVTQLTALLTFISDIGLAASLVQSKTEPEKKDYRTAFTVQQLLAWFIFFILFLLSRTSWLETKLGAAGIWVLLALAFSFPLATFKTISSIQLERKLDFNKLVIPQIFEQIIFNGLLIFLAWRGAGVMAYTYAILARSVIGIVVMQYIHPWRPRFAFDTQALKKLLSFGLKFQANDLLARIKDQLYFLALGSYLPLQDFGFMQWAKNWSMYPYNLTVQNVMSITFPTYSRLQAHKEILKRAIEKSIYFIALFIFPILVGMSIFVFPLTELIPRYQKWQPALPSFVLFSLSVAWAAISTPLTNTLNAIGQINKTLKLMILWTVLTWLLTPLFVWKFAFTGVALAAFVISFTSIFSVWMVQKHIALDLWQQVNKQLLASAMMALLGILGMSLWRENLLTVLLGMFCCAVLYFLTLLLFGGKRLKLELLSLKK